MQRFKKILAVVDRHSSDPVALERARWLAKRNDALLTVVQTISEVPWYVQMVLPGRVKEHYSTFVERVEGELEALVEPIRRGGIAVTPATLIGTPWLELIREVLENGYDLLIKEAEAKHHLGLLHGSLDARLLRKCPCPVWLVREGRDSPTNIAAAIDPMPGDETRDRLNRQIMDLAVSLAELEGSILHVVRAWMVSAEHILGQRLPEEELELCRQSAKSRVEAELDRFLEGFSERAAEIRVHLIDKEAETAIPELVEQENVDLVVMGTVARTGIPGILIGNTAEKVLQEIRCSVLAVKPEGFVSPVALEV